ncbi:MAG: DMT family transporter [Ilumatobacteraceae bacterium]|jgi:drug/metabolite transporter (DMT)-like permease|nr:DMT family transporter [Ilumatobacteraceae bacterium]
MKVLALARKQIAAVPVLAVFIAVFAWGIGPLLFLAPSISINSVLFYRVLFWPPLLYLIVRRNGAKINDKLFRSVLVPGILFGVSTIFGFTAITTTSVANATIIGNISTAMVLFVAPRFLNEKISKSQVVLAFTSFAGVAAIVFGAGNTGGSSLFGDFLALVNALTWTVYFISSKRRRVDGVDTWQFLFGVSVIQVFVVVPYALLTSNDILQITWRDLGFLIAMTLFSGTIGHSFMLWAQKYVDASVSSLILLLGPVISSAGAWLVYGQQISLVQVIGGAIVLASLAGVVRMSSSAKINKEVLSTADPLLNSNP